jgi:hypothetical protein
MASQQGREALSVIHITVPRALKARLVRESQARSLTLTDWVVQKLESAMPNDEQWLPFAGEHHKRLPVSEAVRREVQRAQEFLSSL